MRAEPVDPRDCSWEVDHPAYRVYFWHRPAAPPGIRPEQMGYHCDEWRLTEAADVREVLAWAESRRREEQTYVLYTETRDQQGLGLLRLAGVDPTEPDADLG
jgi:hypothetical protein